MGDITEKNLIFLFFWGVIGTPLLVFTGYRTGFNVELYMFIGLGLISIYLWVKGMMRRHTRLKVKKEIDEIIPKIDNF